MTSVTVSVEEARAVKRFRRSSDADEIRTVLLRELKVSREQLEGESASESTRLYVQAVKRVMGVLFDDELVGSDNG